jgi:hypothetical protein
VSVALRLERNDIHNREPSGVFLDKTELVRPQSSWLDARSADGADGAGGAAGSG